MEKTGCARCGELQERLEAALQERDAALLELARAREELNRRDLAQKWSFEQELPAYPLEAGTAWPVPLRYRIADTVNGWVKRATPGVQRLARSWVRRTYDR